MKKNYALLLSIIAAGLLIANIASAQTIGDYRSNSNGNWNTNTGNHWQRWNGSNWVPNPSQGYPGQNPGTGTVTITGSNAITITASIPNSIGALVIGNGSGTNESVTFSSTSALSLSVAGSVTLNGGNLTVTNASNPKTHTLSIGGDFTIGGTSTFTALGPVSGFDDELEVVFNGTSSQTIGGSIPSIPFQDLTINNSNGVILSTNATVAGLTSASVFGTLNLSNGVLTTTSSSLITLNDNTTVSGGSNSSYVGGPIRKIGNDAFSFPVGKAGIYAPLGISAPSEVTDAFTTEYFRGVPPNQGTYVSGLIQISGVDYWRLDRNTGSSDVNVTLSWSATSADGSLPGMYGAASTVARHNGTSWSNYSNSGNHTGTDIAGGGTITWSGSPYYNSYYTIGLTPAGGSVLPVMFDNVKAYAKNSGVQIEWSNLTERELKDYVVERSSDGRSFTNIAAYLPISNLNDKADYTSFDAAPVAGTNFYRIRASEIGGKVIYSKILRVDMSGKQSFSMYPNPVTGRQLTVSLTGMVQGTYNIRVINTNGQDVYQKVIKNESSSTSEMIELPTSVKAGIYTMLINGDTFTATKMFVVK